MPAPVSRIHQNRHAAWTDMIRQGEIGIGIAIEVSDRHPPGKAAGPIVLGRLERAIAQEDIGGRHGFVSCAQ